MATESDAKTTGSDAKPTQADIKVSASPRKAAASNVDASVTRRDPARIRRPRAEKATESSAFWPCASPRLRLPSQGTIVELQPRRQPGRVDRKAAAYALEIARLRTAGYSRAAIREALANVGINLSTSALRREECRLRKQSLIVETAAHPAPQSAASGPALTAGKHRVHEPPEMDTREHVKRTRVRAYAPEFKAQVLAECAQAGAPIAKVALAHGLNANMIHTWRRQVQASGASSVAVGGVFDAAPLEAPARTDAAPIHIELRQGATCIAIAWPVEAADACGDWLRELLR
jgi:transposase